MTPGNSFILGSKGQTSNVKVTRHIGCPGVVFALHSCECWLLLVCLWFPLVAERSIQRTKLSWPLMSEAVRVETAMSRHLWVDTVVTRKEHTLIDVVCHVYVYASLSLCDSRVLLWRLSSVRRQSEVVTPRALPPARLAFDRPDQDAVSAGGRCFRSAPVRVQRSSAGTRIRSHPASDEHRLLSIWLVDRSEPDNFQLETGRPTSDSSWRRTATLPGIPSLCAGYWCFGWSRTSERVRIDACRAHVSDRTEQTATISTFDSGITKAFLKHKFRPQCVRFMQLALTAQSALTYRLFQFVNTFRRNCKSAATACSARIGWPNTCACSESKQFAT